jgi:pulcherriminic acid synthase
MKSKSAVQASELHDAAFAQDPYPVWRRLQHEAPLFYDDVDKVWVLTRYDDVAAILRDDETYSTSLYSGSFEQVIGETFTQYGGDRHERERSLMASHMMGATLRDMIAPIVRNVIEQIVTSLPSRVDLVGPFTIRLPGLVMADLFSLSGEERERFVHLAKDIALGLLGWEPELLAKGLAARHELEERAARWLDKRAVDGGPDDLIAWLTAPNNEGRTLARNYVLTNVNFLAAAGTSTVDYALRNALWALFSFPQIARRVAGGDFELMDKVFTETLRYAPPVPYEGRTVMRDVELCGTTVPAGAIVRVCLGSASSDESVFARPREFDPFRTDLWPGDSRGGVRRNGTASHFGFGLGSHFCAGYRIARLEARDGIGALFRTRRPRLCGAVPPLRIYRCHLTVPELVAELQGVSA